eukprot:4769122-Pyramimonas_sp.AAC.1
MAQRRKLPMEVSIATQPPLLALAPAPSLWARGCGSSASFIGAGGRVDCLRLTGRVGQHPSYSCNGPRSRSALARSVSAPRRA